MDLSFLGNRYIIKKFMYYNIWKLSLPGLLLSCILYFLFFNCALIFSNTIKISGQVRLSDNPSSGHGHVKVFTSTVQTFSDSAGRFTLEATVTRSDVVTIFFEKEGYLPESRVVKFEFDTDKDIEVNVGLVVLQKI